MPRNAAESDAETVWCRICGDACDGRGDAANHLEDEHDVITNAVERNVAERRDAPSLDGGPNGVDMP